MDIKAIRKHYEDHCYLGTVHNVRVNETKRVFSFFFLSQTERASVAVGSSAASRF